MTSYPTAVVDRLRAFDNARAFIIAIRRERRKFVCEVASKGERRCVEAEHRAPIHVPDDACEPCKSRAKVEEQYSVARTVLSGASRDFYSALKRNRKEPKWPKHRRAKFARETYDRIIGPLRATVEPMGWAVAVHGSLARDVDLVFVPWHYSASDPIDVLTQVAFVANGFVEREELRTPKVVPIRGHAATVRVVSAADATLYTWLDCLFVEKDEALAKLKRRKMRQSTRDRSSSGASA